MGIKRRYVAWLMEIRNRKIARKILQTKKLPQELKDYIRACSYIAVENSLTKPISQWPIKPATVDGVGKYAKKLIEFFEYDEFVADKIRLDVDDTIRIILVLKPSDTPYPHHIFKHRIDNIQSSVQSYINDNIASGGYCLVEVKILESNHGMET